MAIQARVVRRSNRLARIYEWFDRPPKESVRKGKRERLVALARGHVLEIGVGTGRNLACYPLRGVQLVGIDISPLMLERARARALVLGVPMRLAIGDVQSLSFDSQSFDTVLATCVFCSVGQPVRALREVHRVLRPNGQLLLLEHVRPEGQLAGSMADVLSPLARRLIGVSFNRRTESNVLGAGFEFTSVERDGMWRLIVARPRSQGAAARELSSRVTWKLDLSGRGEQQLRSGPK